MDVKVICLPSATMDSKVRNIENRFPGMSIVRAVDTRNMTPEQGVRSGLLSLSAFNSVRRGRTQHSQIPTMGALGLYLSWRTALAGSGPLLLIEQDCELSNGVHDALESFDRVGATVGMIGTTKIGGAPSDVPGWILSPTGAYETHCVVFSEVGRQKVFEYVTSHAADLQVDALLVAMDQAGLIRLAVYTPMVAWQDHSTTTIQISPAEAKMPFDAIYPTITSRADFMNRHVQSRDLSTRRAQIHRVAPDRCTQRSSQLRVILIVAMIIVVLLLSFLVTTSIS